MKHNNNNDNNKKKKGNLKWETKSPLIMTQYDAIRTN